MVCVSTRTPSFVARCGPQQRYVAVMQAKYVRRFYQRYVQGFVGQTFIAVAVSCLTALCNSAESSTPVAPPRLSQCSLCHSRPGWRSISGTIQHLLVEATRLVRVIEENAVSLTPGVLKSLEVLPSAITRGHRRFYVPEPAIHLFRRAVLNSDCFRFTININDGTQLELEP